MAAIGVHIAYIRIMNVDESGVVIDKNSRTTKANQLLRGSSEPRVIAAPDAPSSNDNPTIKVYLQREAAGGYEVRHLDQNMVVTYAR